MRKSRAEYKAILQKIADRMKRYTHNEDTCKLCKIASHIRNSHHYNFYRCFYCIIYFLYPEHRDHYFPCVGLKDVGLNRDKTSISFNNKRMARIIEDDVIPRLDAVPADDPFFTGVV